MNSFCSCSSSSHKHTLFAFVLFLIAFSQTYSLRLPLFRARKMGQQTLWGKEVDVNIPKGVFPSDDEFKEMEDRMPGCQHGWFESNSSQLHYRKFLPSGAPNGVVVHMHGIQTHSGKAFILSNGRKINMALMSEALTKAGYALYALDMLGHGYSEGSRWYIPDWKTNRDDLNNFARFAASQHHGSPLFLEGESYGATLVLHVAKQWQKEDSAPTGFAGMVLNGAAIVGDVPPFPVVLFLRYGLAPFFPRWTPFFMPNPISPDRIWADRQVLALHAAPREKEMMIDGSGRPFCLGTGVGLLTALEIVRAETIPGLTVPFCAIHGAKDEACPIAGTDFLDEHASTPKEDRAVHRLKDAYHDLLGDPAAENTMDLMIHFMNDRVGKMARVIEQL
jgi:alpha-beta hydrolase superfamily lysophospholipase